MSANSSIEWTHHTFNPWRGCVRVSPGCEHCYAETQSKRNPKVLGVWGVNGTRVIASESMWQQPVKWDAAAKRAGERHRVFCASFADVFEDRHDLRSPRERLWEVIWATPHLDWLLLTKRPENVSDMLPWIDEPWPNVWIGTTVEDRARRVRLDVLRRITARVRFVSFEPMLEDVTPGLDLSGIHWTIWGGESGGQARPCALEWIERGVKKSRAYRAAPFVKQLGAYVVSEERTAPADCFSAPPSREHRAPNGEFWAWRMGTKHPKGGDIAEFPEWLQVREFPTVRA